MTSPRGRARVREDSSSCLLLTATLFILLPAATRTWVVTADLWTRTNRPGLFDCGCSLADDVAGATGGWLRGGCGIGPRSGCLTECAGGLMHGALRHIPKEILERHQAGGTAENVVAD